MSVLTISAASPVGVLADGTPYYAPIGEVIVDGSLVTCHLCVRALRSVTAHLRARMDQAGLLRGVRPRARPVSGRAGDPQAPRGRASVPAGLRARDAPGQRGGPRAGQDRGPGPRRGARGHWAEHAGAA